MTHRLSAAALLAATLVSAPADAYCPPPPAPVVVAAGGTTLASTAGFVFGGMVFPVAAIYANSVGLDPWHPLVCWAFGDGGRVGDEKAPHCPK